MEKDRLTYIHEYITQLHIKSNVHKSFLIQHVTTAPSCKTKFRQINVKSRNDAHRLPSHTQSHGLDTAIYNLFLCLTSSQFLPYWAKMPAAPPST